MGRHARRDHAPCALRRWAEQHRTQLSLLTAPDDETGWSPELAATIRAQHAVMGAQRGELLRWRDSGRLSDECLRALQHELDLEERILPGANRATGR